VASEQDIATIFQMLSNHEQLIRDLEIRLGDTNNSIPVDTDTFTGLTDTPDNYSGEASKVVQVNVAEDGLEFVTQVPGAFTDHTDTPGSLGSVGQILQVDGAGTALEFVAPGVGVDIDEFLELTDTPATYSGQGDKTVKVNVGETALEFVTPTNIIDSDHNQETISTTTLPFRTLTIPADTLKAGDTIEILFNLTTVQTLNGNPLLEIKLNGSGTPAIIYDSSVRTVGINRMFLGRCSLGVLDTSLNLTGVTIFGIENTARNPIRVLADHDLSTDMTVTFDFTVTSGSVIFDWADIVLVG